jgi:hypothetical protein
MAADRWGAKPTQEEKKLTPEQFERAWQQIAAKALRGDSMQTDQGTYYVRCGRRLGAGKFCFHRLGHSASCAPNFANVCDAPLPKDKRCVLTVGHKCKCMAVFPR